MSEGSYLTILSDTRNKDGSHSSHLWGTSRKVWSAHFVKWTTNLFTFVSIWGYFKIMQSYFSPKLDRKRTI